jgi:hypothetical protein
MNNSKAKRRALTLLGEARRTLQEALRELEEVKDPDMRLDDAHRFVRRSQQAADQAVVSIEGSLTS